MVGGTDCLRHDFDMFQVVSHLCLRISLEVHVGIIHNVQVGHRQALRNMDSSKTENR